MRKSLLLSVLTLALAACSTRAPQPPAQPPVVVAPQPPQPTLEACQLIRLQRGPTSVLIVPVVEGTRPRVRAQYGDGYASGMGGEGGIEIPTQGYNHGDPDAVIEEGRVSYGDGVRVTKFVACQ